jgi:hypothetical protein
VENSDAPATSPKWLSNVVLMAFLAIAAFYLYAEHRAHLLGVLPWLLLLACPLMHVFMHRGHHRHRHNEQDGQNRARDGR